MLIPVVVAVASAMTGSLTSFDYLRLPLVPSSEEILARRDALDRRSDELRARWAKQEAEQGLRTINP